MNSWREFLCVRVTHKEIRQEFMCIPLLSVPCLIKWERRLKCTLAEKIRPGVFIHCFDRQRLVPVLDWFSSPTVEVRVKYNATKDFASIKSLGCMKNRNRKCYAYPTSN